MSKFQIIKGYVIAALISIAVFAAAYFFMTIRMDMCPLFTTCIQIR